MFKEKNECAREHVRPENRELQAFLGQNRLADKARERTSVRSKLHQALRQGTRPRRPNRRGREDPIVLMIEGVGPLPTEAFYKTRPFALVQPQN